MEFSRLRLSVALVLALLVSAGAGVSPASAVENDPVIVTVKGHVRDTDGKPVAGVVVQSDCGCDAPLSSTAIGSDTTSKTGYYAYRVQRQFALNVGFNDPKARYFPVGRSAGSTTKTATGYVIDVRMKPTSSISGTITAANGATVLFASVKFYDATTGKGSGSAFAAKDGSYVAHVKAGSYKVLFGSNGPQLQPQWYGGFATRDESPTITVGERGSVTGIDATVKPTPTIRGTFTIDGAKPLGDVKEALRVELVDSAGKSVAKTVSKTGFSFVELTPGTYTVIARPTDGSGSYVRPVMKKVTLAADTAINDLVIPLTSIPASAQSTRSAGIDFSQSTKGIAATGKRFAGKITVSSYGDVTGGKVLIYVNGKKVDSRILPASGRVNWATTLGTVTIGDFAIKVRFLGTDTVRPRSSVVYALSGP